ncbi:NAPDH-dependent diflavin reductase [Malassezia caprae]|uniref:NAPDH-dependent diflavin reductase n=1 Tax=Malassezia caprae TaxID=1381934 RepID=A0AAF0E8E6_9BASI|nr:NAPDH-dependent diflavin reductase [Malassezia caprae]
MSLDGTEQLDQPTSPLSSEAETEPLPFDETEPDMQRPSTMDGAQDPENERVAQENDIDANQAEPQPDVEKDPEPSDEHHAESSEQLDAGARGPEDESSLSEVMEEDHENVDTSHLERSALDGLAELAASSSNVPEEMDPPAASSAPGSDASQDEEQEQEAQTSPAEATDEDGDVTMMPTTSSSRNKTSLHRAVMAAVGKRRAAATGGAPSLLVEQDGETSAPASAATSRQGSPVADSESGEAKEAKTEDDAESEVPEPSLVDEEKEEMATETMSNAEEAAAESHTRGAEQADDDAEASQQRQEAMDLVTRMELGFAMLRERLYRERLEELEREADMIQQGTHPELRLLHTLIDTRKERRLAHLDVWLEKSEHEHELRARAEDKIAWLNWRDQAATLRRRMLAQTDRERRKLDREKRLLDVPPPMRRHQPFEVDFVRKPPSYSRRTQRMGHLYMSREMALHDTRGYLAYPDVRGLDEYDAWMDLDQMGIRSALPPPGMLPPGYARPEDVPPHDMYAPYPGMPGDAPMGYYGPPGPYVDGPSPPGPAPGQGLPPMYDGMYVDRVDLPPPPRKMDVGYEKAYRPPPPMRPYGGMAEAPMDMPVSHGMHA